MEGVQVAQPMQMAAHPAEGPCQLAQQPAHRTSTTISLDVLANLGKGFLLLCPLLEVYLLELNLLEVDLLDI